MMNFLCGLMLVLGLAGCAGEVTVAAPASAEVVSYQAPPEPVVEVIPVAPSPRHVWCEGHWHWTGARYVWTRGYWEHRPGYRYYRGGWTHRGGRYYYRPGHWRR